MTEPGLGSGALRGALETIQRELVWCMSSNHVPSGWAERGYDERVVPWKAVQAALSLSSPIESRPASERHPNSGRDKLAGEAIRELGAIEAEKPKALKWLIKWDQAKKLHPSQDVCVADLAALLVHGPQASSEVREALTLEEVKSCLWTRSDGSPDPAATTSRLNNLLRKRAPSRQGAGGK